MSHKLLAIIVASLLVLTTNNLYAVSIDGSFSVPASSPDFPFQNALFGTPPPSSGSTIGFGSPDQTMLSYAGLPLPDTYSGGLIEFGAFTLNNTMISNPNPSGGEVFTKILLNTAATNFIGVNGNGVPTGRTYQLPVSTFEMMLKLTPNVVVPGDAADKFVIAKGPQIAGGLLTAFNNLEPIQFPACAGTTCGPNTFFLTSWFANEDDVGIASVEGRIDNIVDQDFLRPVGGSQNLSIQSLSASVPVNVQTPIVLALSDVSFERIIQGGGQIVEIVPEPSTLLLLGSGLLGLLLYRKMGTKSNGSSKQI